MSRRCGLVLGVVCLLFSGVGDAMAQQPAYTRTDLLQNSWSKAYGINASGQVAGAGPSQAFLYSKRKPAEEA